MQNSKWTKGLGIRPETGHQLEEYIGPILHHVGSETIFFNKTPKAQEVKSKINKWNDIKVKTFLTAKKTIKRKYGRNMGENLCHPHLR